jgi:RNA polymerase sigma factor (TIGR02999 family)
MRDDGGAPGPGEVTRLLGELRAGDAAALDRLVPIVYAELRRLARAQLRREAAAHTMHATGLVHEAYVKLAAGGLAANDRAHFLAIAARAMRQILVDQARRRRSSKRGGGWARTTLGDAHAALEVRTDELIALDEALEQLAPRQRQVVEMRWFAGMQEAEIAAALDVSEVTVRREWAKARAWLYTRLYPS